MVKKTKLRDFNPEDKKTSIFDFEPDELDIDDYVAYPLIPPGLTGLFAQTGSLKSWTMAQLAVDSALGLNYLGTYPTNKRKVIYIDEDTPAKIFNDRLERISNHYGLKLSDLDIDKRSMTGFDVTITSDRESLINEVLCETAIGKRVLILIDCLINVSHINTDRTDNARRLMSHFKEIRDSGSDILVTHHLSDKKVIDIFDYNIKSYSLGSTAIRAGFDSTIYMQGKKVNDRTLTYIRPIGKRLYSSEEIRTLELFEDRRKTKANLKQIETIPRPPIEEETDVFKLFPYPLRTGFDLTIAEMQKRLGGGYSQEKLEEIVATLVREKVITKIRKPGDSRSRVFGINPAIDSITSYYKNTIIK